MDKQKTSRRSIGWLRERKSKDNRKFTTKMYKGGKTGGKCFGFTNTYKNNPFRYLDSYHKHNHDKHNINIKTNHLVVDNDIPITKNILIPITKDISIPITNNISITNDISKDNDKLLDEWVILDKIL